jgi:hypothetical protein
VNEEHYGKEELRNAQEAGICPTLFLPSAEDNEQPYNPKEAKPAKNQYQ